MANRIFSIVLPEDLIRQLDIIALSEQKSRSAVIRDGVNSVVQEKSVRAKQKIRAMLEEKTS